MDEPIQLRERWRTTDAAAIGRAEALLSVLAERRRQDALHGSGREHPIVREDEPYGISLRAQRAFYERADKSNKMSHMAIILEELAEVIHAVTPEEMDAELVQLTASCLKALEVHRYQMAVK